MPVFCAVFIVRCLHSVFSTHTHQHQHVVNLSLYKRFALCSVINFIIYYYYYYLLLFNVVAFVFIGCAHSHRWSMVGSSVLVVNYVSWLPYIYIDGRGLRCNFIMNIHYTILEFLCELIFMKKRIKNNVEFHVWGELIVVFFLFPFLAFVISNSIHFFSVRSACVSALNKYLRSQF